MNNLSAWIEHLHHPLVFAGFGLFLFALIIKPLFLNNRRLTGTATERLLHRAMLLLFLLAGLAIAGGIALSWKDKPVVIEDPIAAEPDKNQEAPAASSEQGNSLSITASGEGKVSIGGDVINADGNVEKDDE